MLLLPIWPSRRGPHDVESAKARAVRVSGLDGPSRAQPETVRYRADRQGPIFQVTFLLRLAKAGRLRRVQDPILPAPRMALPTSGRRIVICDYNQLLQSVTGLLRMSGYAVFQAYDGRAAKELCAQLPDIELLVLNTLGTGIDLGELIRGVRHLHPDMPVLHIGDSIPASLPADVPTLAEDFTADELLRSVEGLIGVGTST